MTGETINGLKSNLKNIYTDSKDSYVAVDLNADADHFIITRYLAPKSDLKIIKNNIDISGKGLRETEKILMDTLPDLTKNLLSSTIIIGQGMPNKFASFSPSGRKELLEKLTKTDFMINDIKERIKLRLSNLTILLRQCDDSILSTNTELNLIKQQKANIEQKLIVENNTNYIDLIKPIEEQLALINDDIIKNKNILDNLKQDYDQLNNVYLNRTAQKVSAESEEFQAYSDAYSKINTECTLKQENIKYLTKELAKLKNITDICPTCGQRIIGAIKPNTEAQEQEIKELTNSLNILTQSLNKVIERHNSYKKEISTEYADIAELQNNLELNKKNIKAIADKIEVLKNQKEVSNNELIKLKYLQQNKEQSVINMQQTINDYDSRISELNDTLKKAKVLKTDCEERLSINKQFDSFSKKEFRGYLLYNIIEYLNQRVKDYAEIIFDTNEIGRAHV